MKKPGKFLKSIVPFLIALVLQYAVTIPLTIIYAIRNAGSGFEIDAVLEALNNTASDTNFLQTVNIAYGIISVIVFVIWYQKVCVRPFRNRRKADRPRGFSFHTIVATILLAIGLQYVTSLVVTLVSNLRPDWLASYTSMMNTAGYSDASVLLLVYSILLAPILEETLFRGLIFRYARYAVPFWFANIWQALLFGLIHMNFIQGIYAFVMGLFLGFIAHCGHGIKYSIPVHILFNLIGTCYSGLIDFTTGLSFPAFSAIGVLLTVFALWLFYTDLTPQKTE